MKERIGVCEDKTGLAHLYDWTRARGNHHQRATTFCGRGALAMKRIPNERLFDPPGEHRTCPECLIEAANRQHE